jgi:virulence-associated protein VagC
MKIETFEKQNPNVLGGVGGLDIAEAISRQGEAAGSIKVNNQTISLSGQDGDNAKIILDALPSSYDFPALISSMEKIANQDHIPLQGVGGSDQAPVAVAGGPSATSGQSQPVAIPFSLTAQTDYNTVKILINDMERSIRPMDLSSISISGSGSNMQVSFQANTYYQTPISLKITQKEITK